ncbi:MAG: hypothetical protein JO297_15535 [Nitrososphaeraceae archaeon]|nr:hypothetical protein [Nitrososphaeraceae archaeon]
MKIKRWSCPFCSQASTRHWNLKVHIQRRHNGIGEPILTAAGSFNSSYNALRGRLEPAATHSAKIDDNFHSTPVHAYKTDYYPNSVSFRTESDRASSSQNRDQMTNIIAEFNELLRLLPLRSHSSQNSDMNNLALLSLLATSLNCRRVQNNNVSNRIELPIGYRVQSCNTCIQGNRLDPIWDGSIELQALTKINHRCQPETLLSSINQQQNTNDIQNVIRQIQADLISYLVQVVNIRIATQQSMEAGRQIGGDDVWLRAQELYIPKLMFEIMADKKLSDDRSWLKEEEYIDLGNISADCNRGNNNNKEQHKTWVYPLIKQEVVVKTLKINNNEVMNFLNITKSAFGAFQVQVDDNQSNRYFVISIAFKP